MEVKEGKIENLLKYVPVCSLFNWMCSTQREDVDNMFKEYLEFGAHILYAFSLIIYLYSGINTKEWNPLNQFSKCNRLVKKQEVVIQKYDSLYKRLFSVNGLADKDKNGFISYDEQFDAWHKMGLIDLNTIYFENQGIRNFPKPTIKDLEKAVEAYESERGY